MRKPRKNYTPAEKFAILRRHLIDRVPISDLCDEYQLQPALFYIWQKLLFGVRSVKYRFLASSVLDVSVRRHR